MRRRDVLSLFAATMLLAAGGFAREARAQQQQADDAQQRPNVLFIAIDDLRPELGAYGEEHIHSPNIDRLAANGMLFERAYAQQSVCSPSRISLMTGLRPDSSRVHDNHTHHRRARPEVVTLTQHFIQQGYHAVDLGKIFHGHMGKWNDVLSWSEPWWYPPQNFTKNLRGYRSEENRAILEKRQDRKNWPIFNAQATEGMDVPDRAYPDGRTAAKAREVLGRLKKRRSAAGQPFFLAVGIEKPHLPFVAPKTYWDLYDRSQIELPPRKPPENAPKLAMMDWKELRGYTDIPAEGDLSDAKARELIHGYYASVSYADALVGKVMDRLKALNLYENTIVVLWGDHGWKLGDYGDWAKLTNFELDTRVPLIVSAPGYRGGSRTDALVELVDLYPSLSELAGLPRPDHLQGTSFVPLLRHPDRPWKQAVFSQFPRGPQENRGDAAEGNWQSETYMGYSMRTDRYRYNEWYRMHGPQQHQKGQRVARELYDHDRDGETVNVIDRPEYAAVADSLEAAFEGHLEAAHRQGDDRRGLLLGQAGNAPSDGSAPAGDFRALWDGHSLAGWHASGGGTWSVEDGVLVGRHAASEEAYGHLVTDAVYDDFTARLEFKSVQGNSGFYFRTGEKTGNIGVQGFQAEVDPSEAIGGLYQTGGRGWVARPSPEEVEQFYKPAQWNEMIVRARGSSVTVWVNGTKTAELTGDESMRRRGRFALQLHGNQDVEVRFRDLQIKGQPVER